MWVVHGLLAMARGQVVVSAAGAAFMFGLTNMALHPTMYPVSNVSLEPVLGESIFTEIGNATDAHLLADLSPSDSATLVAEKRSELDVLESAVAALHSKAEEEEEKGDPYVDDEFDSLAEASPDDSRNSSSSSSAASGQLDPPLHWSFFTSAVVTLLSAVPVWFLLILERQQNYYHRAQVLVYDIVHCTPRVTPFAPRMYAVGSFLSLAILSYGAVFVSWWSTLVWNLVLVAGIALGACYVPSHIIAGFSRADEARLAAAALVAQLLRACFVLFCPSFECIRPALLLLLPATAVVLFVGAFDVQPVRVLLSTTRRVLVIQSVVAVALAAFVVKVVGAFLVVPILTAVWLWAGSSFATMGYHVTRGNASLNALTCGCLVAAFLAYRCFYELFLNAGEAPDTDTLVFNTSVSTCLALLWACPLVAFLSWLGESRVVDTSVQTAFGVIGLLRLLYFLGPHHVYFPPDAETRSSWETNTWWGLLHWFRSLALAIAGVGSCFT